MRKRVLVALGLLLTAVACSEDGAESIAPMDAGSQDATDDSLSPATVTVLYGPRATTDLTPFPSDRYTVADPTTRTGRRLSISHATTGDRIVLVYPPTVARLNELDGFSTTGGVFAEFSQPIDVRGLVKLPDHDPPITVPVRDADDYKKADSPLLLVNVDPQSPERGEALGLVPRYWEQPKDDFYLFDEYTLLAAPAIPLRPSTRYAFVITSQLKAPNGTPVSRSREMERLLEDSPADDYAEEVALALAVLRDRYSLETRNVRALTVFTTASVLDGVLAMNKRDRQLPQPELATAWSVETPKAPTDPRVRFRAQYPAPEYRRPKPDGTWRFDAGGVPIVQSTPNLELFLAFSDGTASGPRPVVIFGHGLGGSKDESWGTAERLAGIASRGAAVFAIDSPEHGSRATGKTSLVTSTYAFFGIDPATLSFDIARARDNFRQMASDQLELVRLITTLGGLDLLPLDANGAPAPDGVPDVDVSRVLYLGHSFGSVQGPTLFALAPEITQATWNVGGAGLMTLLRDSNTFQLVLESLAPSGTPKGAIARFLAITQSIVDPGDPLNFARFATLEPLPGVHNWSPRDVLLQEVVNDTIVPNSTSEALARAAGLELIHPVKAIAGVPVVAAPVMGNLPTGGTGVIAEFDTMNGTKLATHGGLIFSPEANSEYVRFFKSGLVAPHATVPAPYGD